MNRRVPGLLAILAPLLVCDCTSVVEGSKEEFSRSFTCPVDRVEARALPSLHPSDFEPHESPPKDIAADPGRLKMWQADRARVKAARDGRDDIIELRGCGHHVLYACHRFKGGNTMMCSKQDDPGGLTPAW